MNSFWWLWGLGGSSDHGQRIEEVFSRTSSATLAPYFILSMVARWFVGSDSVGPVCAPARDMAELTEEGLMAGSSSVTQKDV
ncbi:hypothetical protein PG994_007517 [Apiospora phragmitis]|uniref:Uncharacterized protein n=1 Tax=Apiospora phragmitis TaxID=2905665 RepID=A0ABR1V479_9PEZI